MLGEATFMDLIMIYNSISIVFSRDHPNSKPICNSNAWNEQKYDACL